MDQAITHSNSELIDLSIAVGTCVREFPQTARVFEHLGIDYCCGGKRLLGDACQLRNLDPGIVVRELRNASIQPAAAAGGDFLRLSMSEMCDSIVTTHHTFLKTELPRLASSLEKVLHKHGTKYAWLSPLNVAFNQLAEELMLHMPKEENILFPAIRSLEQSNRPLSFAFGSIDNPIQVMEHEHQDTANSLQLVRQVTSNFSIPIDACNTLHALFYGLQELQIDLHRHIHKENNILFPRASKVAASRKGCQQTMNVIS